MTPKKRRLIHELAQIVRDYIGAGVPADLERVVADLGGDLRKGRHGDHEARVFKDGPEHFTIELQADEVSPRERFSIAHELGHLMLHMGYKVEPQIWEGAWWCW